MKRFFYTAKPRFSFSFPAVLVETKSNENIVFLIIYWGKLLDSVFNYNMSFESAHVDFVFSAALAYQSSDVILGILLQKLAPGNEMISRLWKALDPLVFFEYVQEMILVNLSKYQLICEFSAMILERSCLEYFVNSKVFDQVMVLLANHEPHSFFEALNACKDEPAIHSRLTAAARTNLKKITTAGVINARVLSLGTTLNQLGINHLQDEDKGLVMLQKVNNDLTRLDKIPAENITVAGALFMEKVLKHIDSFSAKNFFMRSDLMVLDLQNVMLVGLINFKLEAIRKVDLSDSILGVVMSNFKAHLLFPKNEQLQVLRGRFQEHRESAFKILLEEMRKDAVTDIFTLDSLVPIIFFLTNSQDIQGEELALTFALEMLKKLNSAEIAYQLELARTKQLLPVDCLQTIVFSYVCSEGPLKTKQELVAEAKKLHWLSETQKDFLELVLKLSKPQ